MSYQEIVDTILASREILLPVAIHAFHDRLLSPSIVFALPDSYIELALNDEGDHLDLNVKPIFRQSSSNRVAEWATVISEPIEYVELTSRYFAAETSGRILKRFRGINVYSNNTQLLAEVDDDVVGAFAIRIEK